MVRGNKGAWQGFLPFKICRGVYAWCFFGTGPFSCQTCRCVGLDSQKVGKPMCAAFRRLFGHSWEEGSLSFSGEH